MATKKIFNKKHIYSISSDVDKSVMSGSAASTSEQPDIHDADFETAVSATGFGKFNIFLFLMSIPAGWTSMFETTTMSYVFPAAECDLELTLNNKGSLNAITFLGMISSGFFWGFLCDTLGRKKLMVIGYLLDAVFVILSGFAQNFTMLLVFKFFGGFIITGPFAALTAYLSEFHCSKYRSRVQLARGMIGSCGTMILPLTAWAILPQHIHISLFQTSAVLHSWNIFLLVCAMPSLISGTIFAFMPESPKFLMTVGRNEEALAVFQKVFALNTGKPKNEFPIKSLVDETINPNLKHGGHITKKRSKKQAIREGFQQIKPLCFPPHLRHIILVCGMQCLVMLAVNTLRLWLPQIFQAISDYQYYNNGTTNSLCVMLETIQPSAEKGNAECTVIFSSSVYINTVIVALTSMTGYVVAASIINKVGKKILLSTFSIISGSCALSIYFAHSNVVIVILSSLFLAMGGICGNIVMTIVIDLFPTSLRAVTISLVMMTGRSASVFGNLIFPVLLSLGCAPPFFSVGTIIISASLLAIFLPNTELKALK